jgi:hypothetical protein
MAIRTLTPPTQALDLVREALVRIINQKGVGPSPLAGLSLDQLCAGAPQLVYDGSLRAIANRGGLDQVRFSGYRYLLFKDNQAIAAAEVAVGPTGGVSEVSGINFGPFVIGTVTAIQQAEVLPTVGERSYELRLLRIAAMYVMAIWLKGDPGTGDILIPLSPAPDYLTPGKAYSPTEFFEILQPKATARLAFDTAV